MHLIHIDSTQNLRQVGRITCWGKEKPESTWNGMDTVEEQIKDYAIEMIKNNESQGKQKGL